MRGLIIGLPLSALLWGIIWLCREYGWDAVAFLMILAGGSYLVATIWRDWPKRADEECTDEYRRFEQ